MVRLIFGERIASGADLMVGCSAQIFDGSGEKVLLTRRQDNGRWCLPGGQLDPGESVAETCAREVLEETGLKVHVSRLIGVYSDPNMLLTYDNQRHFQLISCHFTVDVVGGELRLSDETTEIGYFSQPELAAMDLMEHHHQRILDGYVDRKETFVR